MKIIKKHPQIFIISLIIILCISFFIAINLGSIKVSFIQLLKGLFLEYDGDVASIYYIRFPRIVIAMLVGAALAIAGLLFQVTLKNPLADPGIIGISQGANLISVLIASFFPQLYFLSPGLSFFGGIVVFVIIYSLSWKSGFQTTRIILIGVAMSYTINAVISFVNSSAMTITSDVAGQISLKTWSDAKMLFIYLIPVLVIALFSAKACNLMSLEDRTLTSLGIHVNFYRFGLSLIAVLLCSVSVAIVGVISFVGLLVPHLSRLFVGHDYKYLLPVNLLLGAILLLLADTLGRVIMAPYEISAAVLIAIIGGPLFIILLKRSMIGDGN